MLDRLLHHAETVIVEGKSYRMKDENRGTVIRFRASPKPVELPPALSALSGPLPWGILNRNIQSVFHRRAHRSGEYFGQISLENWAKSTKSARFRGPSPTVRVQRFESNGSSPTVRVQRFESQRFESNGSSPAGESPIPGLKCLILQSDQALHAQYSVNTPSLLVC